MFTEIDIEDLEDALADDGYSFHNFDPDDGELLIFPLDNPKIQETWVARQKGEGANNTFWGNWEGGYEFCSSKIIYSEDDTE